MHPLLVRKLLYPIHERLRGKCTLARLKVLEQTQWRPQARLTELQFAQLRKLVAFAYTYSPYYRRLLDEHELQPHRLHTFADFAKIPPLTRDDVRRNFHELQTTPRRRRARRQSTGGSTGVPVTVLVDSEQVEMVDAVRLRAHRWFGLEPGAREVVLWGSPIELTKQDYLRALRDWLLNSKLLSAFDLDAATLDRYASVIGYYRPQKIFGYASALYLLACHLANSHANGVPELHAVFATAEPLFDFQRQMIAKVFGCPVAVEYGARDAGLMATECPEGGMHIPAESMHIEILDRNADGHGEIVATNLYSFPFPLIRYRTGDRGSLSSVSCRCGRSLPCLQAVDGRQTDFLVTSTGRVLHALSIIYILREVPVIRQFRVLQETVDHIVVLVVPEPAFSRTDAAMLMGRLHILLGPGVRVDIERVSAIPSTASGKFRYVESKVAKQYLARSTAMSR